MFSISPIPAAKRTIARRRAPSLASAGCGPVAKRSPGRLGGWRAAASSGPMASHCRVKKGSDFVIQYHFHPTGKPEAEKSLIGLYFAKKPPARTLVSIQLPPDVFAFLRTRYSRGRKDFVIRDSYTLPVAVDAVSIGAHAHYIAKINEDDGDASRWRSEDAALDQRLGLLLAGSLFLSAAGAASRRARGSTPKCIGTTRRTIREIPSNPPIEVKWGEQSKDEMGSVTLAAVPHRGIRFGGAANRCPEASPPDGSKAPPDGSPNLVLSSGSCSRQ